MEKFTLKDFIGYNNPCFSCNENIKLGVIANKIVDRQVDRSSQLRPLVSIDGTIVDLEITYNKMLQLYIEHNTNKIIVSDVRKFSEYLKNHKLFFTIHCSNCQTNIQSFYLDFDLKRQFLKPTKINKEYLQISDQYNLYSIRSDVFEECTNITVMGKSLRHDVINIKTPLLLLGKFKTKEKWLHKLKTYLIFS